MQDLDDAGFVCGSARMYFDTLRIQNSKRPREDHEPGVQKKDSDG